MSGYLDVKSPFTSSKGFSTWKVWKKQWCTLRPCPVKNGIVLVFHAAAGVSTYSQVEIPNNVVVCRVFSKTKAYAFGIFTIDSEKPILYLSGQSETESQLWMLRIRMMVVGKNSSEKIADKRQYFNISLIDNDFSKKCGYKGLYGTLIINSDNFIIFDTDLNRIKATFEYKHISGIDWIPSDVKFSDYQKVCVINTNSTYKFGSGKIFLYCSFGKKLVTLLQKRLNFSDNPSQKLNRRKSRSEGSLFNTLSNKKLSSEYSQVSDILSYENSPGKQNRCYVVPENFEDYSDSCLEVEDDNLYNQPPKSILKSRKNNSNLYRNDNLFTSSLDRRCSTISAASGIYEEISEHRIPKENDSFIDCTYESLNNFDSMKSNVMDKKSNPPPLPPRLKSPKNSGIEDEWLHSPCSQNTEDSDSPMKNGSIMSLGMISCNSNTEQKDNDDKSEYNSYLCKLPVKNSSRFHNAFDAFRRRIKSESNVSNNKHAKFESYKFKPQMVTNSTESSITPTKSAGMFKNIKLGKASRKLGKNNNLKPTLQNAASFDALDKRSECNIVKNRLSKSHDYLETDSFDAQVITDLKKYEIDLSKNWSLENSDDDNVKDLSILCAENVFRHDYPDDIIDFVLKGDVHSVEEKMRQRSYEDEYVIMSPIGAHVPKKEENDITKAALINGENNYVIMRNA